MAASSEKPQEGTTMANTTPESSQQKQKPKSRLPSQGQLKLLWLLLSKVPLLVRVALLHLLHFGETSGYLDVKSVVILALLRAILETAKPQSVSKVQAMSTREPPVVKGKVWVSKTTSQVPPETGARDALMAAVAAMHNGDKVNNSKLRVPDLVPVEAEWQGYRAAATSKSELPRISEKEKYEELTKEAAAAAKQNDKKSYPTVLYLHGGGYYLGTPATYRILSQRLFKELGMGGRAYAVRYRLAPQSPFPAAILDALVSYLTLLYPPPGSFHEPVKPEDLFFAGDSAGGNLSLTLLQLLLQFQRQGTSHITWFGEARPLPLPRGVLGISPWIDITQSMFSLENRKWCYLPPPALLLPEGQKDPHPSDEIWPVFKDGSTTDKERRHLYVDDEYLLHPLVSLQLTTAEHWKGSPPICINLGWETLADEGKYFVAKCLLPAGVKVVFEEYEAMPHVFAVVLPYTREAGRSIEGMARFVKEAWTSSSGEFKEKLVTIGGGGGGKLVETPISGEKLTPWSEQDARAMGEEMVRNGAIRRVAAAYPETTMARL